MDDNTKRPWKTDIGEEITEQDWERINKYGHQFSSNVGIREIDVRSLTDGIIHSLKLAKMFPGPPDKCWKCEVSATSFWQMWWSCKKKSTFWEANT